MTETLAYIRQVLDGVYPPEEINSLIRLIMKDVCGLQPYQLLLDKDRQLTVIEKERIAGILLRLQQSEPIQYILGKCDFYDLTFKVTPATLIPRPETEELVELILSEHTAQPCRVLDIGTGSGCIALTIAKHRPDDNVTAVDLSNQALAVAKENAKRLGVNNVSFIRSDILSTAKATEDIPDSYDLIVSNPPYVMEKEKAAMDENVLQYEPSTALFVPDDDPLLFYRAIARFGKSRLNEGGGILYLEINAQCGSEMIEMLEKEGYEEVELKKDLCGKDRIIIARR